MSILCLKNEKFYKVIFVALIMCVFCPLVMWGQALGDVNASGTIDIIDALLTAQYYVGLNPANFQIAYADVNGSGGADIIDALLIAQYYVGLITEFPGQTQQTPGPTQVPGQETQIVLNGNSISVNGAGASVNGTNVTIGSAGTYNISGTLNDGRIIVDTEDEEIVTLILNGININSSINSPLSIMAAEEVVIVLADNTQNYITDQPDYVFEDPEEDEPNAALFSKDDFSITGNGSLTVQANYNDGITSKDSLVIEGGTITVNSVDDGIRGKDYLVITSGTITVNSEGDCLKSDKKDEGYITIENGYIDVTSSGGDAIQGEVDVTITGGTLDISSGGGSNFQVDEETSAKGIKSGVSILIGGGNITIDSADDAIHANTGITINDGTLTISTADDAVHGEYTLDINGGDINVIKSYEGLESEVITINNGDIHVTADDDGINAADAEGEEGGMFEPGPYYIHINGGYTVVNITDVTPPGSTGGDGLDSNGYIDMTNGTVIIHGNSNNVDSAIDYNGTFTMTSGFLVGTGTSIMAMAPGGNNSSQNSLLYNFDTQQTGALVNIQSSNGNRILTFAPNKRYASLAFTSPNLVTGTTYNVYFGGSSTGTAVDGLYQNGTYNPGSLGTNFTVNSTVTTIGGGGFPGF